MKIFYIHTKKVNFIRFINVVPILTCIDQLMIYSKNNIYLLHIFGMRKKSVKSFQTKITILFLQGPVCENQSGASSSTTTISFTGGLFLCTYIPTITYVEIQHTATTGRRRSVRPIDQSMFFLYQYMYSIIVYTTIEKTYFDLLVERFAVARPWHCGKGGPSLCRTTSHFFPVKKRYFVKESLQIQRNE